MNEQEVAKKIITKSGRPGREIKIDHTQYILMLHFGLILKIKKMSKDLTELFQEDIQKN